MQRTAILLAGISVTVAAHAAGYYRCVDANGNTTYSQTACSGSAVKRQTAAPHAATSRHETRDVFDQLEAMERLKAQPDRDTQARASEDAPCDRASSIQLRNARVGKQLMKCQTKSDVQAIYGSPTSTANWPGRAAYDTRWSYHFPDSTAVFVYFKNDRVVDWSTYK